MKGSLKRPVVFEKQATITMLALMPGPHPPKFTQFSPVLLSPPSPLTHTPPPPLPLLRHDSSLSRPCSNPVSCLWWEWKKDNLSPLATAIPWQEKWHSLKLKEWSGSLFHLVSSNMWHYNYMCLSSVFITRYDWRLFQSVGSSPQLDSKWKMQTFHVSLFCFLIKMWSIAKDQIKKCDIITITSWSFKIASSWWSSIITAGSLPSSPPPSSSPPLFVPHR